MRANSYNILLYISVYILLVLFLWRIRTQILILRVGFLPSLIWVTIIKYYRLGSLEETEIFFSTILETRKSKIGEFACILRWGPFSSFIASVFLVCPHMKEGAKESLWGLFYKKDIIHEHSTLMIYVLPKGPTFYHHITSGFRISTYEFWGGQT